MFKPSTPEKIRGWKEKIFQQQNSGLSIERWCKEKQVTVCQFHYWKSKLFPKQINASSFTELVDTKNVGITIECDGLRIHLDPNFDTVTLKRCLSVIKEGKC
jgi:predicted methyltransferase